MRRAHRRDGARTQKFWFRKHLAPPLQTSSSSSSSASGSSSHAHAPPTTNKAAEGAAKAGFIPEDGTYSPCYGQVWGPEESDADACEEMTIEEILTGKGDYFLGLIPLCNMYLDYIGWVGEHLCVCYVYVCVCTRA